jgi:cell division protease FtsH
MKYTSMIQSIVLSTILLGCTIQAEINNPQEHTLSAAEEAQVAEIVEFAQDAVSKAFRALQKVENKLTEIALLVKKGLFKDTNSNAVMQVLTENKMTINALLQSQASIVSLQDPGQQLQIASVISEFCNAFIPYLDKQIKSNFKNAKPFDLHRFLNNLHKGKTRNNFDHLEPAALNKGLKITHAHLKILNTTVKNVGLTWYNKTARAVDKWVVTPANKWHVPTIAAYGTGLGLLGAYTLYSYGWTFKDRPFQSKDPEKVEISDIPLLQYYAKRLYIGKNGPMVQDRKTGILEFIDDNSIFYEQNKETGTGEWKVNTNSIFQDEKTKEWKFKNNAGDTYRPRKKSPKSNDQTLPTDGNLFASADHTIKEFLLNNQPLGYLAGAFMLTSLYKTWKEDMYPKFLKNRDTWWNFLRGGEYMNTHQKGLVAMEPTVSFKDMVGLDEVKEAFYQILQYVDNPEQLMRIEATPEKGWLLTGPPRTGKTFSVECLFGEIKQMMAKRGQPNNMKFFNINATLINEYGITAILNEVAENAPAVIFIDEIDLLGLQRVGNNKLLSDFLTAMQSSMNADPAKVVILIAATNKPENIDSALRQNGRFGKEIRFDYPSRTYRSKFLIRELTNMALNIKEFDIEALTNKTNDKTFEDLKRVMRHAMTRSWMRGSSLTQELLEESIDTELHKLIMFNRKDVPEGERRIVATHFAGMALAALNLETYIQLDKVTTHAYMADLEDESVWESFGKKDARTEQKKIEYGKFITRQSNDTINAKNATMILNDITLLLAGFAAEELLLGSCGFTCHPQDNDKAYKLVEKLVFGGLNQELLPKTVREELRNKAYTLLKQCHEIAMKILIDNKQALEAIVEELVTKQILSDKEIQTIIKEVEDKNNPIEPIATEEITTTVNTQEEQKTAESAVTA